MNSKRNDIKAGVLILISVALIILLIVGIKGIERIIEPGQVRTARFTLEDDLGGLRVGDDVRLGGFKVGAVEGIRLVHGSADGVEAQPHILVTFTLPRKYELKRDAVVGVQGTLTGSSWLNFSSLGEGVPLERDVVLVGRPGVMGQIMSGLGDASPKIGRLIDRINERTLPSIDSALTDLQAAASSGASAMLKVEGHIDPVVERYNRLADAGADAVREMHGVVSDNREKIQDTVSEIAGRLPGMLEKTDAILAEVETALSKATASLDDLKRTSENARELSAAARGLVVSNRGRIHAMVKSLKATGDNLKAASGEIRRSPWRLLYRPRAGEMANLNLFDSARQFADGASELNDAAGALRDALGDPTLDEARLRSLIEVLDATFARFGEVEEELWSEVRP